MCLSSHVIQVHRRLFIESRYRYTGMCLLSHVIQVHRHVPRVTIQVHSRVSIESRDTGAQACVY